MLKYLGFTTITNTHCYETYNALKHTYHRKSVGQRRLYPGLNQKLDFINYYGLLLSEIRVYKCRIIFEKYSNLDFLFGVIYVQYIKVNKDI